VECGCLLPFLLRPLGLQLGHVRGTVGGDLRLGGFVHLALRFRRGGLPRRVGGRRNLRFIAAAQVDSAVLIGRADVLGMQLEIGKGSRGPEIRTPRVVYQFSVPGGSVAGEMAIKGFWSVIDRLPAGEVLAVEERLRIGRPRRHDQ
jgi:hypothetical protein